MHTVYLDGVFDLFHASHISFIQKVRKHAMKFFQVNEYDIRIVAGVISDKDVESYKRTPVMTLTQRVTILQHCNITRVQQYKEIIRVTVIQSSITPL